MYDFDLNNILGKRSLFVDGEKYNISIVSQQTGAKDNIFFRRLDALIHDKKDMNKLLNLYSSESAAIKSLKCLLSCSKETEGYVCNILNMNFRSEFPKCKVYTLSGHTHYLDQLEHTELELEILMISDIDGNIKTEKINKNELKIDVEKLKLEAKKKKAKKKSDDEKKQEQIEIEKNKKNKFRLIRFN